LRGEKKKVGNEPPTEKKEWGRGGGGEGRVEKGGAVRGQMRTCPLKNGLQKKIGDLYKAQLSHPVLPKSEKRHLRGKVHVRVLHGTKQEENSEKPSIRELGLENVPSFRMTRGKGGKKKKITGDAFGGKRECSEFEKEEEAGRENITTYGLVIVLGGAQTTNKQRGEGWGENAKQQRKGEGELIERIVIEKGDHPKQAVHA